MQRAVIIHSWPHPGIHTVNIGSVVMLNTYKYFIVLFYSLLFRLSIYVTEAGGTETIPQLLLQSPSYHNPCLHLLFALVASKHEPAILEIRKHLPVSAVCQILTMEHRPEVRNTYDPSLAVLSAGSAIHN